MRRPTSESMRNFAPEEGTRQSRDLGQGGWLIHSLCVEPQTGKISWRIDSPQRLHQIQVLFPIQVALSRCELPSDARNGHAGRNHTRFASTRTLACLLELTEIAKIGEVH